MSPKTSQHAFNEFRETRVRRQFPLSQTRRMHTKNKQFALGRGLDSDGVINYLLISSEMQTTLHVTRTLQSAHGEDAVSMILKSRIVLLILHERKIVSVFSIYCYAEEIGNEVNDRKHLLSAKETNM